jgi:tape measure domain-containing protein
VADNELYRQEIVIEVNDNDASEKVNKFEQKFKRSTDRMSKMAQSLGRQKIEPMMQARDKLTASVMKADRLVKKLDAAHASPIIAAQDKVSSVVTRVNAMIDAINRKDAKVVAEMKGPLMDELVQAKRAVADLGDIKTGPVAELKGELFSQLSRAQSMMRNVDRMAARPRVSVHDMASSTIRNIDKGLRSLANKTWSVGIRIAGGALNTVKSLVGGVGRAITSPLAMLGVGVGAAGAVTAGIAKPLELAGDMEQSKIAFETMLGSAEKANAFLRDMQKFATTTPFEFPELQENAKLMLAFGFSTQKVMPMLKTVGDTAAGLGAGSEGINRMVRALGQMQAKGRAQTEELMQLQELGVPVNEILRQELGMTAEQIANIGKEGVASGKVIDAVLRGMDKRFGGLMDKQSRSLKGLWSTIKDTFNMNILLRWGEGIRRAVEPRLQKLVDWFGKNESKIEDWGNTLEKVAGEASDWVLRHFESAFKWLDTNFFSNEEFKQLDFKGKISFAWDKVKDEFDTWYQGSGQKLIASWGEKIGGGLGSAIGAGLMALVGAKKIDPDQIMHTPLSKPEINTNPFVEAGTNAAESFLKGFADNFDLGAILKGLMDKNLNTLKEPSWSNIFSTAIVDWIVFGPIIKTLGKILGPFVKGGKWIFSKLVPSGAKTASAGAAGTGAGTASSMAQGASAAAGGSAAATVSAGTGLGTLATAGLFAVPAGILTEQIILTERTNREEAAKEYRRKMAEQEGINLSELNPDRWVRELSNKEAVAKAKAAGDYSFWDRIIGVKPQYKYEVYDWNEQIRKAQQASQEHAYTIQAAPAKKWWDVFGLFDGKKSAEAIGETSEKVKDFSTKTKVAQADTDRMNNQLNKLYGGYGKVGESATISSDLAQNGMNSMANAVDMTMNGVVNKAAATAQQLSDPSFAAGYNLGNGVTSGVYAAYSNAPPIVRWMLNTLSGGKSLAARVTASVADINRMNIQEKRLYGIPGHAKGIIAGGPHLAMVAEEGPEAVIPLSRARRSRALKLWQQTGQYLGVDGYAEGGYTAPVAYSKNNSGTVINLYMDGLIGTVQVNSNSDIEEVANIAANTVVRELKEIIGNKAS